MYRAWIPNIIGRLSFRLIGDTSHPTQCVYSNTAVGNKRYIIAFQRRQTADHVFPSILSRFLGIQENFWFVFIGRAPQNETGIDGKLIGKVFLFKNKADWKTKQKVDELNTCEKTIKNCQNEFYKYSRKENLPSEKAALYQNFIHCLMAMEKHALVSFKVVLNRNGLTSIYNPKIRDQYIRNNSEEYAKKQNYNFYEWLTNSAYFFLRDITHEHQHHHPNQDTILTVHQIKGNQENWYNRVLFALYYSILSNKRSKKRGHLENSLGIIAYAKSFQNICDQRGIVYPEFNNDEAIISIKSLIRSRNLVERNRNNKKRHFDAIIIAIIASLIAIFTLVTAYDKDISHYDQLAKNLAAFINQYISVIFGCMVVLVFVLWSFSRFSMGSIIFDVTRLTFATTRTRSIILMSILSLSCAGFTLYFLIKLLN